MGQFMPIKRSIATGIAIVACIIGGASLAGEISRGEVASVNSIATQAGIDVLRSGGNAIDAAVAVGLTLGVVDSHNSGIGGGCFMLIHLASGTNVCIDGRETAPALATRDMFLRHGQADTALSQTGPLASGVPGEIAAFDFAESHYGRKTLRDVILPAAGIAENGFPLDAHSAHLIQTLTNELKKFPASAAIFLPDGRPLKSGAILKQPDLSATYRHIADHGIDWFYHGSFAQKVDAWMKANGGVLRAGDFDTYHVELRQPIHTSYRGYEIASFPPPSSGGVHVLEMLNILENFNLKKMDAPTRLHVIAETMKLAFADRAYWLGDPEFVHVPRGLIAKPYAAELAKKIDLTHTTRVLSHGSPPDWQTDFFAKHTTHFSTADAEGNWVACTATINTSFGSKVIIPGTGVVMNDEMDDFSIQAGVPNHFGLIGAEANSVAPGKRPLSSMSPAIVFKDGQPLIALGAAGGPKIISAVLLELVDMLDLGMTAQEAVAAPRIHHQWSPDELVVESKLPDDVKKALVQSGHKLKELSIIAVSQIVARSPDGTRFTGAADPREGGTAAEVRW